MICIAPDSSTHSADSEVLLQAYPEAIPHSEEGTFQTQPPRQQYCYRYLDDANRTVIEVRLYIYCECVNGTLVIISL